MGDHEDAVAKAAFASARNAHRAGGLDVVMAQVLSQGWSVVAASSVLSSSGPENQLG
jgi:hypothetical protein